MYACSDFANSKSFCLSKVTCMERRTILQTDSLFEGRTECFVASFVQLLTLSSINCTHLTLFWSFILHGKTWLRQAETINFSKSHLNCLHKLILFGVSFLLSYSLNPISFFFWCYTIARIYRIAPNFRGAYFREFRD